MSETPALEFDGDNVIDFSDCTREVIRQDVFRYQGHAPPSFMPRSTRAVEVPNLRDTVALRVVTPELYGIASLHHV